MIVRCTKPDGSTATIDFAAPNTISIPLRRTMADNPNAYGLTAPTIEPFRAGEFIGSVAEGAPVNCEVMTLVPHGNGTHTECVGHIATGGFWIADAGLPWTGWAVLITVQPEQDGGDYIIYEHTIKSALAPYGLHGCDAVIIRTAPNGDWKKRHTWSGTNPPYLHSNCGVFLRESGIKHLILDLPSVDRETDGGVLAAHHAFWNYPESPRLDATITEMVYVDDSLPDGLYVASIHTLAVESDASPSVVALYRSE
ncbi:MAG: cyclase family protein [Candidatus Kapabacteria bacterium]|nr:cyclase family protein [Candidatus Kapabacteria bacterium]